MDKASDRWADRPWVPVALKCLAALLGLAGIALLGSGALDRWLSAQPAFASARAASQLSASSEASAARRGGRAGASASSSPSAGASVGAPPSASASASTGVDVGPPRTPDGRVILNRAGEPELRTLPGVGERKARAILELRAKLGGRFKRLEDLTRVRGIKRRFLERLRPKLSLDGE